MLQRTEFDLDEDAVGLGDDVGGAPWQFAEHIREFTERFSAGDLVQFVVGGISSCKGACGATGSFLMLSISVAVFSA